MVPFIIHSFIRSLWAFTLPSPFPSSSAAHTHNVTIIFILIDCSAILLKTIANHFVFLPLSLLSFPPFGTREYASFRHCICSPLSAHRLFVILPIHLKMSNIFDRLECKSDIAPNGNDKVCEFILNFSLHCGICAFATVFRFVPFQWERKWENLEIFFCVKNYKSSNVKICLR